MRRGTAVFVSVVVSVLASLLACGSFTEGVEGTSDAGGGADGPLVDGASVDASSIVEAAPSDGNPCSSRAAKISAGNYFEIPSTEGFDFPLMTVEAWIYVPAASATKPMQLVSNIQTDKLAGWALALVPGPQLVFYSFTNGSPNTLGGSAAAKVATNRWVHVAVTRAMVQVQLIIDGSKSAPFSDSFKFGNAAQANFTVGASSIDGLEGFDGLIEEVRISNVVREISIARKTMVPDANTIALWRFDETGSDAVDSSGNGKNLGEEGEVPRICMARFADDDVTP